MQPAGTPFWQRAVVGIIVASVVGSVFMLSLVAWPEYRDWNTLASSQRGFGPTFRYIAEPLLLGLYVFLAGPLIAWVLARRYAPHATPSLFVLGAFVLVANVAAAVLVGLVHLRTYDGALNLPERLMDVLVRVTLLFCGGVLATFVVPRHPRVQVR